MTVPLPTNLFENNAYFYANNTYNLGAVTKPADAITLVAVDYTKLSQVIPDAAIFSFLVDRGGGPPLKISSPALASGVLTFLVSKGIPGASYTIEVNMAHDTVQVRSDSLIVDVPQEGFYNWPQPIPLPYSQGNGSVSQLMIGDDLAFISTAPRYFVGSEVPEGPNIMDQWYNPVTATLGEFVTDGTNTWWSIPVPVTSNGVPTPTGPGLVLVTAPYAPFPYMLAPIGTLFSIGNIDLDMGTF